MADFGKLNFAVAFVPQTAFPLDGRTYFESLKRRRPLLQLLFLSAALMVYIIMVCNYLSLRTVCLLDIVSNRIRLLRKSMVFLPRILSESFNLFA